MSEEVEVPAGAEATGPIDTGNEAAVDTAVEDTIAENTEAEIGAETAGSAEPGAKRERRRRRERREPREPREQREETTISAEEFVQAALAEVSDTASYLAVVRQFAALMHTAGLGQTLAYFKTEEKPEVVLFTKHLGSWTLRHRRSAGTDLLEALIRRTNGFHEEAIDESVVFLGETLKQLAQRKS